MRRTRTSHPHPARRRAVAAAATLLTTAALAGCGAGADREEEQQAVEGDTTGVTDDSIVVGGHFPLTGVAAPGYSEIPGGAKAYFDFVN